MKYADAALLIASPVIVSASLATAIALMSDWNSKYKKELIIDSVAITAGGGMLAGGIVLLTSRFMG